MPSDIPPSFKIAYLPPEVWPAPCRARWEEAFAETGLFDEPKPATRWRRATIRKNRSGFGALVSWTLHAGLHDPAADIGSVVTRDHVAGFVAAMREEDYAPYTVACHVQEIHDCACVMDPSGDWSWLLNAVKRTRASARPLRNKLSRLQPAERLERLGLDLMDRAQSDPHLTRYKRALMFRDGFMIAFLIRRPLRIANLQSMDLDGRVVLRERSAVLVFPAEEMKGKRPFEVAFPPELFGALETYLAIHRPFLLSLGGHGTDLPALWISNEGLQMADVSIRNMIKKRTARAFEHDLTPHLFRDSSVTTLVRDAPESARITRSILGHATLDVTNKHYNQARMVEVSRRHTDLIERLLDDAQPEPVPCEP